MKPLNQSERNNMLLKFVFLFVFTVGITVFAIFFDFKLPQELNESQRRKLKASIAFNRNQAKIIRMMDTLDRQIVDLGNSNRGWEIQKDVISKQINFGIEGDSSMKNFTDKIDRIFADFLAAEVRALKAKDKLQECESDYTRTKETFKEKEDILKEKAELNKETD